MSAWPRQRTIAPPLGILERLAVDTHSRVAMVAAANPNSDPVLMERLAEHDALEVRQAAAEETCAVVVGVEHPARHICGSTGGGGAVGVVSDDLDSDTQMPEAGMRRDALGSSCRPQR